jgi:hypothetical protein
VAWTNENDKGSIKKTYEQKYYALFWWGERERVEMGKGGTHSTLIGASSSFSVHKAKATKQPTLII